VTRVLVNVGDTITRDQPVLELETDKATIEVPSSVAGVVKEIKVKQGEKVKVGAVVLTVDDGGGAAGNGAGAAKSAEAAKPAAAPAQEPAAPAASADAAKPEAAAKEPTPSKAPEPAAAEGRDHKVISMPPRSAEPAAPAPSPAAAQPAARQEGGAIAPASPAVRRLAREIGVEITTVAGTGPAGRISQDDVKEHARRILISVGSAGAAATGAAPRAARALPDFQKWGEVERQPWSNIRRATAEHLSYAWSTIPHVTQFDKADITALDELRKKYKAQIEKAGGNLTVAAMLVKILATALRQFPDFNASIDSERGEIVYKKFVNIGVAVDTDRGLLVPVIRQADQKNISQIAVEMNQLAAKARERKLTLEEMSGGSMSLSNLGGIGGTYFTPIVNWPEVAILGVSRGVIEPVWRGDKFEPRQMLPLSLSYDHRAIDGADAIRFLRWVVEAVEQPFLLSLIG
jgi:pyruvate dehydrogenase E2 component (dihydrolipoamide acetyltransferase)